MGWMRKVDEEVQRVGKEAGIRVNKTDRDIYLVLQERDKNAKGKEKANAQVSRKTRLGVQDEPSGCSTFCF